LAFRWLWFDGFHGGNMKVFVRLSQHFPGVSGIHLSRFTLLAESRGRIWVMAMSVGKS
jgi:hypothetical protein